MQTVINFCTCLLKKFASLSPDFENCAQCLLNFKPFTDDKVEKFKIVFENLVKNFDNDFWNMPAKTISDITVVSMSGIWYRCFNGHINCIIKDNLVVEQVCYECKKNENNQIRNFQRTSNMRYENNALSRNEFHTKNNFHLSSNLQSSSKLSIEGIIRQDELRKDTDQNVCLKIASDKQMITSVKDNNTCSEDAVGLHTDHEINEEPITFLSSLLLKKLSMMCTSEHRLCDESYINKIKDKTVSNNTKVSESATKNKHITNSRKTVKSKPFDAGELSMYNSSDLSGMTFQESFTKRKNDTLLLDEARTTGAISKTTSKPYRGSHNVNRGHAKFYKSFAWNLCADNTSKSFQYGNALHEGCIKKKNGDISPNYHRRSEPVVSRHFCSQYPNMKTSVIIKPENSLQNMDRISNSGKFSKAFKGQVEEKYARMLPNYERAIETNTSRRYRGHHVSRGQIGMPKSRNCAVQRKESITYYGTTFEESSMKQNNEILLNDTGAILNITKNMSRPYRGRGNGRPSVKFK